MSQAYHARPSSILGISEGLPAFAVDRAVLAFAKNVESEQEVAVGRLPKNAKEATINFTRQRVLDAFLGIDPVAAPGRFRDPATRSGR